MHHIPLLFVLIVIAAGALVGCSDIGDHLSPQGYRLGEWSVKPDRLSFKSFEITAARSF